MQFLLNYTTIFFLSLSFLCLYLKVEVYVNEIPATCSGDCAFTWDPRATPLISSISPSQGNFRFILLTMGLNTLIIYATSGQIFNI